MTTEAEIRRDPSAPDEKPLARLFVAGNSAYSVIALSSLRAVIDTIPEPRTPEVIVIDVLQHPAAGLEYRVYVTPTLVLTAMSAHGIPETSTMIGDLADRRKVEAFLSRLID